MAISKNRQPDKIPVDASKLNMGTAYDSAPEYYYEIELDCVDCKSSEVWTARNKNGGTRRRVGIFSQPRYATGSVAG